MKGHRGLLLAGVGATLFGGFLPAARGSCAAPQLEIVKPAARSDRPAQLIVGESVTAKGLYWLIGCDDTGGGYVGGCNEEPSPEPQRSYQNVEVSVVGPVTEKQHRRERGVNGARFSRVVGEGDADANGSFRLSFTVPALPKGRYYLIGSEIGQPEPIRITPAESGNP